MNKLETGDNFTIEDIHKIRKQNYEATKELSLEEQCAYYRKGAEAMLLRIEEKRRTKLAQ